MIDIRMIYILNVKSILMSWLYYWKRHCGCWNEYVKAVYYKWNGKQKLGKLKSCHKTLQSKIQKNFACADPNKRNRDPRKKALLRQKCGGETRFRLANPPQKGSRQLRGSGRGECITTKKKKVWEPCEFEWDSVREYSSTQWMLNGTWVGLKPKEHV